MDNFQDIKDDGATKFYRGYVKYVNKILNESV